MRAWVVIAVAVLAASACQADEDDLRGLPPPCVDGWRACAGECIRADEVCGQVTYANSASQVSDNSSCMDLPPLPVTVPDAASSVLLVSGCIRTTGLTQPSVIATYAGTPLQLLGQTIAANESGDYYRSMLFWGADLPAGPGEVSITTGTVVSTSCTYMALVYSGVSPARPDYHGATTELGSVTVTVASAPDELAAAALCLATFNTSEVTLVDDAGQTRRHFQTNDFGGPITTAAADAPGAAPTVELGWRDLSGPSDPSRRTAVSAVSLAPYCPTCVGIPVAPVPRTILATDDFTRPDNVDLGAAWDPGLPGSHLELVGGRVRASTASEDVIETYNQASLPNDQWAQLTLSSLQSAGEVGTGPVLRWTSPPANDGYYCEATRNGTIGTSVIYKYRPVITPLAISDAVTWLPGDTIRCEAVGPLIRLLRTSAEIESLVLSASDTAYFSGRAGILEFARTTLSNGVDDFAAGGFGGP